MQDHYACLYAFTLAFSLSKSPLVGGKPGLKPSRAMNDDFIIKLKLIL